MSKGATTPPMCPICGVAHWLREPHVFGGARIVEPQLMSPRPGSARERQMVDVTPSQAKASKAKPEPIPRTARATPDGDASRPSRGGGSPAPLDVARAALAEAEKPKPKRNGRPATGFDKKAYDRQKAAERRAAAKAAKA